MYIKIKQKNKTNSGFSLVETLVAISIFSLSILGLMSVLASGISDTNYAKSRAIASYLAQEGIEYVRNIRDNYVLFGGDWTSFTSGLNSCSDSAPCGFNNSTSSGPTASEIFLCSEQSCKLYVNNGNYNNDSVAGIDSGFTRKIWVETVDSKEIRIFSEVSWTQGSGEKTIILTENLFNWY